MRTTTSFVFVVLIFLLWLVSCSSPGSKKQAAQTQVLFGENCKFKAGDSLQWADTLLNDASWEIVSLTQAWEKQGHPGHDGYGWYRLRFTLPSALRKNAYFKDSVKIVLGKIDDYDQVFLNGQFLGQNNRVFPPDSRTPQEFTSGWTMYDVSRSYVMPVDDPRLKWDRENLLAVRVFDSGGPGGMYDTVARKAAMLQLEDYFRFDYQDTVFQLSANRFRKTIAMENLSSQTTLEGTLYLTVRVIPQGKRVYGAERKLVLQPKERQQIEVAFEDALNVPHQTTYRFFEKNSKQDVVAREEVPYILTPPEKPQPRINGAMVYGQRPGKPFLYRIAATGQRPMQFTAEGLPSGLKLDAKTGIITGRVYKKSTYPVQITVSNALGSDTKTIKFIIGDQIALTPPMGWNSWNCWGLSVTQDKIYAAARAFVEKGLVNHGWTYINIDDGWEIFGESSQPRRKPNGEIRTNEKFPDMRKLGRDIHALGLKFGIYSSPGPLTCGGYTGSYRHEEQDARTFARWGVDYLKYDLCSYRKRMKDTNSREELIPPYRRMHKALQKVDRDIVYSLCEYGYGKVWEWGAQIGGNLWRTTGDIWDDWERMFHIGFHQEEAAPYAGPGHWNDPDMLVVGWLGWGEHLHPSRLTPTEQYTHVSLWALLSAPLLLGNDLERLDAFTLNLITNDEVIAIDQDPLGEQAIPVIRQGPVQVYWKNLADGNLAVGIFNTGKRAQKYILDFKRLGIDGKKVRIRDVWRQKELGTFARKFSTTLLPHGVTLVKVFK